MKHEIIQVRSIISDFEDDINMKYRRTFRIVVLVCFGVMLLFGEGCKKESGKKKVTMLSLEELRTKAEGGDADAQYSLGMIYQQMYYRLLKLLKK